MDNSFSPWLQFAFWYFSLVCSNSPPIAQLIRARPDHALQPSDTVCRPVRHQLRDPLHPAEGLWKWAKLSSLKFSLALIPVRSFIYIACQRLQFHTQKKKRGIVTERKKEKRKHDNTIKEKYEQVTYRHLRLREQLHKGCLRKAWIHNKGPWNAYTGLQRVPTERASLGSKATWVLSRQFL